MNKKYEMFKENPTDKLYRIRSLRYFGDVKKGDIGGFVEKESNLSHDGNCWIYNDGKVYDNAIISDNAHVYGYARVYNNAEVFNYARIFDHSQVYENAKVFGYARIFDHAEVYDYGAIYGHAEVYDYAKISGNAQLSGNARIFDNAEAFDYAQIYDDAIAHDNVRIYHDAKVYGNAKISGENHVSSHANICRGDVNDKVIYMSLPKHNLTVQSDGFIKIGCECYDIDYWIQNYEEIGTKNNYKKKDIELYGSILKQIKNYIS